MWEKFLGFLFMLSAGMIFVGVSEYFTASYPDKWYFGMGYRFFNFLPFFPLSDYACGRLIFAGLVLMLVTGAMVAMLNNMGVEVNIDASI